MDKSYFINRAIDKDYVWLQCQGRRKCQYCVSPKRARPALYSVGIDVFKTVRKFDLPTETLSNVGQIKLVFCCT